VAEMDVIAPGYSLVEVVSLIQKIKVLWDSFHAEFDSAENRIGELHDTFSFLSQAYHDYHALLAQYNRIYPGERTLLRKLQELQAFLNDYRELLPGRVPADKSAKVRRAWQTAKFSADQHIERLNHGLKLEMQKLALSMAQLSL
jgi:uncharacterized coiled-coil DUF342 family protein